MKKRKGPFPIFSCYFLFLFFFFLCSKIYAIKKYAKTEYREEVWLVTSVIVKGARLFSCARAAKLTDPESSNGGRRRKGTSPGVGGHSEGADEHCHSVLPSS